MVDNEAYTHWSILLLKCCEALQPLFVVNTEVTLGQAGHKIPVRIRHVNWDNNELRGDRNCVLLVDLRWHSHCWRSLRRTCGAHQKKDANAEQGIQSVRRRTKWPN